MILYSVTSSLDPAVEQDWLAWMRATHIPQVMATGLFTSYKLLRIMDEEEGGVTYNAQYMLASRDHYELYRKDHAPALQADTKARFEGRYAAFRTLLEVVEANSYLEAE